MEGWQGVVERGTLHPVVQAAKDQVGDAWTWRNGREEDLRPAFFAAYREMRERAIREIVLGPKENLGKSILKLAGMETPGPTMAALPESDKIHPRIVEGD